MVLMTWMKIGLCFLVCCFFGVEELSAKIRILTFHYNRPDFLELQYATFKQFILDDYEVIVFNDAIDPHYEKLISDVCQKHGWQCVRYEPSWHETNPLNEKIRMEVNTSQKNSFFLFPLEDGLPSLKAISQQCSIRHCHVIQYALDHFGYSHDDIVVIMDADVFPIKPTSVKELLKDLPLVGIDSEFKYMHYVWVPFIAFDPKRLPNIKELQFHVDLIDDILCDTGSHSYHYLKDHPEVNYRLYPRRTDEDFFPWDLNTFAKFGFFHSELTRISWPISMEFYIDYHFVHYCGGSADAHPPKKHQAIFDLIRCCLPDTHQVKS